MVKYLLPLSIIYFSMFSYRAASQSYFIEGYIVKSNGDTITGLVEYFANDAIPQKCVFRRFDLANQFTYNPASINAFGIMNGSKFESKKINDNPRFLKVIVKGKISVYSDDKKWYIEKNPFGCFDLSEQPIVLENGTRFHDSKELIKDFFKDKPECLSFENKNIDDLISSVCRYNSCALVDYRTLALHNKVIKKTEPVIEIGQSAGKYGVVTGTNYYSFKLVPPAAYKNIPVIKAAGTSYFLGAYYNTQLSRRYTRLKLHLEIDFNLPLSYYAYGESTDILKNKYRNDVYLSFQFIKVPIAVQYEIPVSKVNIRFGLGSSYNFFISKKYKRVEESETSSHLVTSSVHYDFVFNSYEGSNFIFAGCGFKHFDRNFYIGLRLEYGVSKFEQNSENYYYNNQQTFDKTFMQYSLNFGYEF